MVWYNLTVEGIAVKYAKTKKEKINKWQICDESGDTEIEYVKGSLQPGYYVKKSTGEKVLKVHRMVNGKISAGFTGRIKDVSKVLHVPVEEAEDLEIDHKYVIDSQELYDKLKNSNQALKFLGWFGNGFTVYKCYIFPSKVYEGFCVMIAGEQSTSENISSVIEERIAEKEMQKRLSKVKVAAGKVNNLDPEELLALC